MSFVKIDETERKQGKGTTLGDLRQTYRGSYIVDSKGIEIRKDSYELEPEKHYVLIRGSSGRTCVGNEADLLKIVPGEIYPLSVIPTVVGGDGFPSWLKKSLPGHNSPVDSLLDLRLPVAYNPFYISMLKFMKNTVMGDTLMNKTNWDKGEFKETVMLGSSGSGKTSACLALAVTKWIVYLSCPDAKTPSGVDLGTTLRLVPWANVGTVLEEEELQRMFRVEAVCRLHALLTLIRTRKLSGETFAPLDWLIFCMSEPGGQIISRIRESLLEFDIGQGVINDLLKAIDTEGGKGKIVLILDEVQILVTKLSYPAGRNWWKCVWSAATLFPCAKVWCGTRVSVDAALGLISPVLKTNNAQVSVEIVGDFQYLGPGEVEALLEELIDSGRYSESVRKQLSSSLSGRARLLAFFVSAMFPTKAALSDPPTRGEMDEFLLRLLEETCIRAMGDFDRELKNMRRLPGGIGLSEDDMHQMWAHLLLNQALGVRRTEVLDHRDRCNNLMFVEHVQEIAREPSGDGKYEHIKFEFKPRYGEQSLLEAVQRVILFGDANNGIPPVERVQRGILAVLRSARFDQSALGTYFDYALAASLVTQGPCFLSTFCKLAEYRDGYCAQITRVVGIVSVKEQLDWFERVLADPDDVTWPLMPGIPVRNIAILPHKRSGADVIFLAQRKPVAASTTCAIPPTNPVEKAKGPWCFRSSNKRNISALLHGAAAGSSSAPTLKDATVVVHVCGTITKKVKSSKVVDQEQKSGHQFVKSGGEPHEGEVEYKQIQETKTRDGSLVYLPHVFEMERPANKVELAGISYINDANARNNRLFSNEVMDLVNRQLTKFDEDE